MSVIRAAASDFTFDWNSTAPQSFGEKLYQAIEYLSFKAANHNAVRACETIEKIVSEQQKYRLFQKFFPDEWRASRTSVFKTGYYSHYSERVNEFFDLVNARMFPLLSGWNDDPETDFENFFIFSLNFDLCCEEIDPEHLRVGYSAGLLFYFQDGEIWDYFANRYKVRKNDFPEINDRPHENLWLSGKDPETKMYVEMFELVDHSTGNPWLDRLNCQGGGWYGWDEETILQLARSYKEANELLERIESLDALIEANPKQILLNLITLWNEGRLPDTKNERRTIGEK